MSQRKLATVEIEGKPFAVVASAIPCEGCCFMSECFGLCRPEYSEVCVEWDNAMHAQLYTHFELIKTNHLKTKSL